MRAASALAAYAATQVSTVTPSKLVVLLYERLVLDLQRGEHLVRKGDMTEARKRLSNAHQIVLELGASLDQSRWAGASSLAALYSWFSSEITRAATAGDPARVAAVRVLVEPLRDAWVIAERQLAEAQR